MATKTKTRCRNCGSDYTVTRPMCEGDECDEQRLEEVINPETGAIVRKGRSGICIFCCYNLYRGTQRVIYITQVNYFLCYYCGYRYSVATQRCKCCTASILCPTCCTSKEHTDCCKKRKIEFRNSKLSFVHPISKTVEPKGVKWLDRDASLTILTKTAPVTLLDPKGFIANPSHRYASVELELFDYKDATDLNRILSKWKNSVVHDGSIFRITREQDPNRLNHLIGDRSFEINTSPACGSALIDQLQDICEALDKAEAKVSIGCGVHVHVDCRDFGYQEIQRLIKVYFYLEEALFAAVHWTRYANEFCAHCGNHYYTRFIKGIKPDTKSLKSALIKSVYGDNSLKIPNGAAGPEFWAVSADHYGRNNALGRRNENRYAAMNFHSYFLRGTVESRIHHGSVDFQEIYSWVKLHLEIFDAIYHLSETKLGKLLEISGSEVDNAKELIGADRITRKLNLESAALGVVVLRSLVSDESFENYLEKVRMACHDEQVSKYKILPCEKGKVTPSELLQKPEPVAPQPQPPIEQDVVWELPNVPMQDFVQWERELAGRLGRQALEQQRLAQVRGPNRNRR